MEDLQQARWDELLDKAEADAELDPTKTLANFETAVLGGHPDDGFSRLIQDERYVINALQTIRSQPRIIGGVTDPGEYPDCVAVGTESKWCCSGTLVAPNVVISAAHCHALLRCAQRVFVGTDVTLPQQGRIVDVTSVTISPSYDKSSHHADVSVLILAEHVAVDPRPIADRNVTAGGGDVRLVGYGRTNLAGTAGFGLRRLVDVALATPKPEYGVDASIEFAAGAIGEKDTCTGDSGGPAYFEMPSAWVLAGVTSRPIPGENRRRCGDGGIYTRTDTFLDWIKSVPGGDW